MERSTSLYEGLQVAAGRDLTTSALRDSAVDTDLRVVPFLEFYDEYNTNGPIIMTSARLWSRFHGTFPRL
jgi:hypothetical protein